MKFIYFGYDFMLDCAQRLINDGHTLSGIYTFPCDNIFNFNTKTYDLAKTTNCPIIETKVTPDDLDVWTAQGVTCFIAAGYPYKIPPIEGKATYGINIHPSRLPKGRGMMPTPTIIMSQPNAAGLTIHKLSPQIDQGDIIDQIPIEIAPKETVETYASRIALAAPSLLSDIIDELPGYWRLAKPQDEAEASTFPTPNDDMRMISWDEDLNDIDAKARAFGRYGCLAMIKDTPWAIYDHDIWHESHDYTPGTRVLDLPRHIVIAAKGGYLLVKDGKSLSA